MSSTDLRLDAQQERYEEDRLGRSIEASYERSTEAACERCWDARQGGEQ